MTVRDLYHSLVPSSIRNPIGMARRELLDRIQRMTARPTLPPRTLLANIQVTPFVSEYLLVGSRSARTIIDTAARYGISGGAAVDMLDFGCGSARILRHLGRTRWRLHGCDTDSSAVHWAAQHIRFAEFKVNGVLPPLPYEPSRFDLVIAISLFTHFSAEEQRAWIAELARVMKAGALLLLSTMGPSALERFPAHAATAEIAALAAEGFAFIVSGPAFNQRAAFHTRDAIAGLAQSSFELLAWHERGLDGFQDLSVLRRTVQA